VKSDVPYATEASLALQGFLPEAGGIYDQPAPFVDAFRVVTNEMAVKAKAEADAVRRKARVR
jgi:hypothetical protein